MKAAIVTIGSELLVPGKADTNTSWLIGELAAAGVEVTFLATVGDDREGIVESFRLALCSADLVLSTGGLGPTSDDLTREAVANLLGLEMVLHEPTLEKIRRRFAARGFAMPEVNRKQAMVPVGAEIIENEVGTAPGIRISNVESSDRQMVLLPGPPSELHRMFDKSVFPELVLQTGRTVYRTRKLWIVGLPESSVEQLVSDIYTSYENPVTTILASSGQVELRLTAKGVSVDEAHACNEDLAARIRSILGEHIFSESEEELEEVISHLLIKRGFSLGVAESVTGGLIAHRITNVAGSSHYFDLGLVTYSNEAKTQLLGVDPLLFKGVGAVSEEVALAMATGIRHRSGSDLGLATTGIAGPGGDSVTKPVGLVYTAVSGPQIEEVERFQFSGKRSSIKRWASQAALNKLRLILLEGR